ncbi:zinc-binding dehydrogenase [Saccharopolyspora sp. NPDC050389]|uniref:zinc-binding dehydrogenase n=1 Tax=Saccharopolyspora sp. NPDC050389 TaxID=3155516 RepID=UPI0033C25B07
MRVVQVTEFGGPEVLTVVEAADPVPGAGQVAVRASAVDVLFLDTQLREGWGQEYFATNPPYVPGNGVAGVVVSAGDGVDPSWLWREVVASTANGGTYAELAVVDETELLPVPDGLDPREAVALLHDGTTAMFLAEHARIEPGERVLVTGAAGGAASVLVQLARAAGAQVVGAARGETKLNLVRELGGEPVDYATPDWAEQVRKLTGGVDVVFDGVGGRLGRAAFEVANAGARVYTYGAASGGFAEIHPAEAQLRNVTVVGLLDVQPTPEEKKPVTGRALAEAAAGRIKPTIGQTFPLERAADAHTAIAARTTPGRTLLLP